MKKTLKYFLISLVIIFLILFIPTEKIVEPKLAEKKQFVWNRDSLWNSLEQKFIEAKQKGCTNIEGDIKNNFIIINLILEEIKKSSPLPNELIYQKLEEKIFVTAALVGGCEQYITEYAEQYSRIRTVIKNVSVNWDISNVNTRNTLYKIIYGGRAAVEELLLQTNSSNINGLTLENDEESQTPSASILGVRIHSGDILVSRGGAPTSALIARGSDYPGNFSHIALVYVDAKTKLPYIIESHIERGITISSLYDYLKDIKLRVMVLRLRKDLHKLQIDPMLPHKAALFALQRAEARHIPYDFEMDLNNDDKWFCSEVASSSYKKVGISLWAHSSTISSRGTAKLLSGFGVTHFETQEPSDLEYDPQVTVVAEWRDMETLYKDHVDNAIVEALLDEANYGKELKYNHYLLPIVRIAKLVSVVQNIFGADGIIPEGMSAESGLRHQKYENIFIAVKQKVLDDAEEFLKKNKYRPPYWKLVGFAKNYVKDYLQ